MSTNNPAPGKVFQITSLANPRIKQIRGLHLKKNREAGSVFLAEGQKLAIDAMDRGWEIETLILDPSQGAAPLAAKARAAGADVLEVNRKVLSAITRKDNPQTVLSILRQRWVRKPARPDGDQAVWIALDRVRDPGNLGTVVRTADAAGAEGVLLVGDTTDPFSFEAVRASMGSIFNVSLCRMSEAAFIDWLPEWPGNVVGTHLEGTVDYRNVDYQRSPVLLLMGNEQQGLSQALTRACSTLARMPMAGSADSLNLAIATGIMLFHMAKHPRLAQKQDG